MLSDAVTRILSAGLIVIFNAATVIQSVLWIIMYPTVSCPTLSCQLLQKNVSHNLANREIKIHVYAKRQTRICTWVHVVLNGTMGLFRGTNFDLPFCAILKEMTFQNNPTIQFDMPRSSLGAKMVNRPFARDGHMVQKTPCWKVNNAVVPWKERILAIWMISSLCF